VKFSFAELVKVLSAHGLRACFFFSVAGFAIMAQPAKASFNLTFSQSNWTLSNNGSPVTDPAGPGYSCDPDLTDPVNCFLDFDSVGGNAQLLGDVAASSTSPPETTAWVSATPASTGYSKGYYVSFSLHFDGAGAGDYAYYSVNGAAPTDVQKVFNQDTKQVYLQLGVSDSLSLAIFNPASNASVGQLTINGFNANPVPGPLPAAGAASAFGFSRRLRRRVKNDGKSAAPRRLIPSDPSAYLKLSTPALNHLPASFCYASAPRFISPSSIPAMNSTYRPSPADQGSVDGNDVESSLISSTQS
jgi:hypothetical protein